MVSNYEIRNIRMDSLGKKSRTRSADFNASGTLRLRRRQGSHLSVPFRP